MAQQIDINVLISDLQLYSDELESLNDCEAIDNDAYDTLSHLVSLIINSLQNGGYTNAAQHQDIDVAVQQQELSVKKN